MFARRYTMLFASLAVVAAVQQPVSAQAEPWSLFDWTRPYQAADWGQPIYPIATPAPRPQRVATVLPEPARKPAPRVLIIGIGF
jgi:hypothetical protein